MKIVAIHLVQEDSLWQNIYMSRWIRFIFAIFIGIGLGLLYGWLVNPVKYVDTTPDTLRTDYKTDYVLMVSEAFQSEGDPALAVRRLAMLGETPSAEMVYQAILFAQKTDYNDNDLTIMQALLGELQAYELRLETPIP